MKPYRGLERNSSPRRHLFDSFAWAQSLRAGLDTEKNLRFSISAIFGNFGDFGNLV
jgi:hypothetical protein